MSVCSSGATGAALRSVGAPFMAAPVPAGKLSVSPGPADAGDEGASRSGPTAGRVGSSGSLASMSAMRSLLSGWLRR